MKKCPYCAEEIQDEAILCRYCGKELEPELPPDDRKKCLYCAEWIRVEAVVCRYCRREVIKHTTKPSEKQTLSAKTLLRGYRPPKSDIESIYQRKRSIFQQGEWRERIDTDPGRYSSNPREFNKQFDLIMQKAWRKSDKTPEGLAAVIEKVSPKTGYSLSLGSAWRKAKVGAESWSYAVSFVRNLNQFHSKQYIRDRYKEYLEKLIRFVVEDSPSKKDSLLLLSRRPFSVSWTFGSDGMPKWLTRKPWELAEKIPTEYYDLIYNEVKKLIEEFEINSSDEIDTSVQSSGSYEEGRLKPIQVPPEPKKHQPEPRKPPPKPIKSPTGIKKELESMQRTSTRWEPLKDPPKSSKKAKKLTTNLPEIIACSACGWKQSSYNNSCANCLRKFK